jgi:hypothetical protein
MIETKTKVLKLLIYDNIVKEKALKIGSLCITLLTKYSLFLYAYKQGKIFGNLNGKKSPPA